MQLRQHYLQHRREDPAFGLPRNIERLDVEALLDSLIYPVVWTYDHYLTSWMPGEITIELATWLSLKPVYGFDERKSELLAAGLLDPEGRLWWEDLQATYIGTGVVAVPNMIAPEYAKWISAYYHRQLKHDRWPDMPGISRTSLNDIPLARLLHSQITKMMSYIVNDELKPSYSFAAAYDNTSNLPKHRDRPQCVYNMSLLFDCEPQGASMSTWPLHVQVADTTHSIAIEGGSAAIYSGTKDLHWRDKMPANLSQVTGIFMHYVPSGFTGSLA